MESLEKEYIVEKLMRAVNRQGYFYYIQQNVKRMEQTAHDECIWNCAIDTFIETFCREFGIEYDVNDTFKNFHEGEEEAKHDVEEHAFD